MGNSINLYGSIGYTYLINNNNKPNFILVLSDNHSKLPYCNNYTIISDWLKGKMNHNNILLEEVPRDNNILKELFISSDHTQKLKNLFINNPKLIKAIDIRPSLIKFSWELCELTDTFDCSLNLYLEEIDSFFNFNNIKINKLNANYNKEYIMNSKCYTQFKIIKNIYLMYREKYKDHLNQLILYIFNNHKYILDELNGILDNIMEFYIILNIFTLNDKNAIIHTGLLHSEKIIFWLTNVYSYNIIDTKGINNINHIDTIPINNGCIELSKNIDDQFSK